MKIQDFVDIYGDICKGTGGRRELDVLFKGLSYKAAQSEEMKTFFPRHAHYPDKLLAIKTLYSDFTSDSPALLQTLFPQANHQQVKDKLLALHEVKAESFAKSFDDIELPGICFLSKQVGKTTREDIAQEIKSYENLLEAQKNAPNGEILVSDGELVTLARYNGNAEAKRMLAKRGNPEPLCVGGYASVEVVDREGHLITVQALKKSFARFIKSFRTRNITIAHSDVQVAWVLPVYINEDGEIFKSGVDKHGLWVISEIRPDIQIAERVRKSIESGEFRSYSIAGSATDKESGHRDGKTVMIVNDLELAEIAICEKPVNQESHFNILKSCGNCGPTCKALESGKSCKNMKAVEIYTQKSNVENKTDLAHFSPELQAFIGEKLGVNWSKVSPEEFAIGMRAEQEHKNITGGDTLTTAKIVLAHLQEVPDYYSKVGKYIEPELLKASDIKFSVKAIIKNGEGKVLILKDAYSSWWDLPGGHMKNNEVTENALHREVLEESGLQITSCEELATKWMKLGREEKPVAFYLCTAAGDIELSHEHVDYRWIGSSEIKDFNLGVYKEVLMEATAGNLWQQDGLTLLKSKTQCRIGCQVWDVEVANTFEQTEKGLGGRSELKPHAGMLFDLGRERGIPVTTMDMLFPIDIVFAGRDMVVNEVLCNVQPGRIIFSSYLSQYFMEANAGDFAGISVGDQLECAMDLKKSFAVSFDTLLDQYLDEHPEFTDEELEDFARQNGISDEEMEEKLYSLFADEVKSFVKKPSKEMLKAFPFLAVAGALSALGGGDEEEETIENCRDGRKKLAKAGGRKISIPYREQLESYLKDGK